MCATTKKFTFKHLDFQNVAKCFCLLSRTFEECSYIGTSYRVQYAGIYVPTAYFQESELLLNLKNEYWCKYVVRKRPYSLGTLVYQIV